MTRSCEKIQTLFIFRVICGNTAHVQWIKCSPKGSHLIRWMRAVFSHITLKWTPFAYHTNLTLLLLALYICLNRNKSTLATNPSPLLNLSNKPLKRWQFLHKLWRSKGLFQFEIIINVLVSTFWFIWIPMLWVYGRYKYFYSHSAGSDFRHQNMTSTDVRFWRLKSIPAL